MTEKKESISAKRNWNSKTLQQYTHENGVEF
jgi:hypothetical protein